MRTIVLMGMLSIGYMTTYAFSGSGLGTEKDPYLVTNADELFEVRNELTAHYRQTCDIDLTTWIKDESPTYGWAPIGTQSLPFEGSFDGANFSIKGLKINRSNQDYVGLFGYARNGTIKNVCLLNPVVEGGCFVGALVGFMASVSGDANFYIENNTIQGGKISANSSTSIVGGLIGGVVVSYSSSSASLICGNYVTANVCGYNTGGIAGCLSTYSGDYSTHYINICDNIYNGEIISENYAAGIALLSTYWPFSVSGHFNYTRPSFLRNIVLGTITANGSACGIINSGNASTAGSATNNVCIAESLTSNSAVYRVSDAGYTSNYACITTAGYVNGKPTVFEDNAYNGTGYGIKTLMRQSTYEGMGFDFTNTWTIDEGKSYPYFLRQSKVPTVTSFTSGSKANIAGTADGYGKIYVFINDALYETDIVDGQWSLSVGNVSPGTQAMVSARTVGKAPSVMTTAQAIATVIEPDIETGDANGDGAVDAVDVVSIINYILGKPSSSFNEKNADANGDGQILVDDAVETVNIIMNKQ